MLTVNEQKAVDASKGIPVKDATNQQFGAHINKCAAICGTAKLVSASVIVLMKEIIEEQFPWCTMQDMERACIMNAAKQLLCSSDKDAKTENQPVDHIQIFGELNNANVCAILFRYYPFRSQARIKNREENMVLIGPHDPGYTVTEEMWQEMFDVDVQRYSEGKDYWSIIAGRMLEWLQKTEKLTQATFTEMEWAAMRLRARQIQFDKTFMTLHKYEQCEQYQRKLIDAQIEVHLKTVTYEAYIKRHIQRNKAA